MLSKKSIKIISVVLFVAMLLLTVGSTVFAVDVPKANQIQKFKISEDRLFNVVPKNIERDKLEDFVIKACEFYSKHLRNKERER